MPYHIKKPLSPCKDCDRRTVGCHGSCEAYAKYKSGFDEWTQMTRGEKNKDKEIDQMIKDKMRRKHESD